MIKRERFLHIISGLLSLVVFAYMFFGILKYYSDIFWSFTMTREIMFGVTFAGLVVSFTCFFISLIQYIGTFFWNRNSSGKEPDKNKNENKE